MAHDFTATVRHQGPSGRSPSSAEAMVLTLQKGRTKGAVQNQSLCSCAEENQAAQGASRRPVGASSEGCFGALAGTEAAPLCAAAAGCDAVQVGSDEAAGTAEEFPCDGAVCVGQEVRSHLICSLICSLICLVISLRPIGQFRLHSPLVCIALFDIIFLFWFKPLQSRRFVAMMPS